VGLFLHTPFPSSELFRSASPPPPPLPTRPPSGHRARSRGRDLPAGVAPHFRVSNGGGRWHRPQLAHREEILYGMLAADHIGFGLFEYLAPSPMHSGLAQCPPRRRICPIDCQKKTNPLSASRDARQKYL
jgi:hypothetical protein